MYFYLETILLDLNSAKNVLRHISVSISIRIISLKISERIVIAG